MQLESTTQRTNEWVLLLKQAAWYAFKISITLRVGTLVWMVILSLFIGRTLTEPNVLCKTRDLVEHTLPSGSLLGSWLRWDTVCYLLIAETGYMVHPGLTVWPPVYPLLIRLFSLVFAPPILAALAISGLATWLAFILLYLLVTETHDKTTAKNTLFLYAVHPLAFFLLAGYTESLFLALTIGCLLLARRGRWLGAGLLAALATLTRNQGIVLSLVLLWEGILQYREGRGRQVGDLLRILFASSMPLIAFGGFALYVRYGLKADWPWQTLAGWWGQYTGFPWQGIFGNIHQLLTLPVSDDLYWLPSTILDLLLSILIPVILLSHRRYMRSTYLLFSWLILFMGLIKLGPDDTLISFSRYVIVIFPFFVAISPIVANRYSRLAVLTLGLIFQAILLSMFYIWSWAG